MCTYLHILYNDMAGINSFSQLKHIFAHRLINFKSVTLINAKQFKQISVGNFPEKVKFLL